MKQFSYIIVILTFLLPLTKVYSAPSPTAVEQSKENATLEVIGNVEQDILLQDTSITKNRPSQLRQFTLKVEKIIKNTNNVMIPNQKLEVVYSYIPRWNSNQYSGPKHVDISVGDKIHIWLKRSENGWISAHSGNTIDHINYSQNRSEAIKEPIMHQVKRNTNEAIEQLIQPKIVFLFLFTLLLLIIIGVIKRQK